MHTPGHNSFNGQHFLQELRGAAARYNPSLGGTIPRTYQQGMSELLDTAVIQATQDVASMRLTPGPLQAVASQPEKAHAYSEGIIQVARTTGLLAVRLAGLGNDRFASALVVPDKQDEVLDGISQDHRQFLENVSDGQASLLTPATLSSTFVAFHGPEKVRDLQRQHPDFSFSAIAAVIQTSPREPHTLLDKINDIRSEKAYELFMPDDILAVLMRKQPNERAVLDRVGRLINTLAETTRYADLDIETIKDVVIQHPKTYQRVLNEAVGLPPTEPLNLPRSNRGRGGTTAGRTAMRTSNSTTETRLLTRSVHTAVKEAPLPVKEDATYRAVRALPEAGIFTSDQIKQIIANHPDDPELAARQAGEAIAILQITAEDNPFTQRHLAAIAANGPVDQIEERFSDAVTDYMELRKNPLHKSLRPRDIRDAVAFHSHDPASYLDALLRPPGEWQ